MALDGYRGIEPLGGSKDKGRDAIHVDASSNGTVTLFAYSVREDWRKKLDEDSAKIRKHGHPCHRLAFLCTAQFTATERDKAVDHIQTTYRWTLDLYGLERLRNLLVTTHRQLVAQHPQIFCPQFFPVAGGLSLAFSPDHVDADAALAKMKFSLICDHSNKARNWRVAILADDPSVILLKVFVETIRFEPSPYVPNSDEIRKELVNFRRIPLMWTDTRGNQPSPKVDGKRGLPVTFDFIKHIKEKWAADRLQVCHGLSVEEYNPQKHKERSRIRDGKFVRERRDTIRLLPYEITLAATAENAETCIQDFRISIVDGKELVEMVDQPNLHRLPSADEV
jgi:hypothetical protein